MDLYQVCSNYAPRAKNGPAPGSHCLHRLIYGKTLKKNLVSSHKALSLDIWYVASPSRPLPRLFKLCSGAHMFYIGVYWEKYEKIFLSETTRPRALIFGRKHHIVNLYQVCSNYIPGAKNGPLQGSHVLHRPIKGKTLKFLV